MSVAEWCTLFDSVCGCALHSALPQGKGCTSVGIKVNYLKGINASSGVLTVIGKAVKSGSRIGAYELVRDSG